MLFRSPAHPEGPAAHRPKDPEALMFESLSQLSPVLILGAVVIGVMLVKKLIKVAVIVAVIVFVVLPYLDSTGALDSIKSALGL